MSFSNYFLTIITTNKNKNKLLYVKYSVKWCVTNKIRTIIKVCLGIGYFKKIL